MQYWPSKQQVVGSDSSPQAIRVWLVLNHREEVARTPIYHYYVRILLLLMVVVVVAI